MEDYSWMEISNLLIILIMNSGQCQYKCSLPLLKFYNYSKGLVEVLMETKCESAFDTNTYPFQLNYKNINK